MSTSAFFQSGKGTSLIDADLLRFTERMTKILEQVIRENPTQWLWFQKRWNTPPEMQKTNKHHTVKARRKLSEDAT